MDSNEKQPDIKLFIRHLTTKIKDIQTETFKNIKSCRGLNDELDKIKNFQEDCAVDLVNFILDQLESVEIQFKSFLTDEKNQCISLKQQVYSLSQENMKFQQNCFILGTRTEEMEKSVGIGLKLPSINFNPE